MLPDFICVGTGRSGTSWLYEVLLEHPEVCTAKGIKETQFFNEHYEKGLDWYRRFFSDCGGRKATGEISNRYIFQPEVAGRIKKAIPGCRIIICLRNPFERIQSVYSFQLREGVLDCSFEEALERMPELIEENRYHTLVKPYFDLFGTENIFILDFDALSSEPAALCRNLFRFLGVDEGFVPSVLGKKVNRAVVPRFPLAGHLAKGAARTLRRLGLYRVLTEAKRSDALKSIIFKQYDYKDKDLMTGKALGMISPVVLPEIARLERLLGRSFDGWKK